MSDDRPVVQVVIDALYLVLAEELDADLVVADERLLRSLAQLSTVRPLSAYP